MGVTAAWRVADTSGKRTGATPAEEKDEFTIMLTAAEIKINVIKELELLLFGIKRS